jgi:molybdopterin-binding protein
MSQLSARNQLRGKVTAVQTDGIMAEVTIDVGGGNVLTSVITRTSATNLGLKVGDTVTAVIKSTEVLVLK